MALGPAGGIRLSAGTACRRPACASSAFSLRASSLCCRISSTATSSRKVPSCAPLALSYLLGSGSARGGHEWGGARVGSAQLAAALGLLRCQTLRVRPALSHSIKTTSPCPAGASIPAATIAVSQQSTPALTGPARPRSRPRSTGTQTQPRSRSRPAVQGIALLGPVRQL